MSLLRSRPNSCYWRVERRSQTIKTSRWESVKRKVDQRRAVGTRDKSLKNQTNQMERRTHVPNLLWYLL